MVKLSELSIKNFRGYEEVTIDFDDEINVIIGRNDVGKSTILDALEIFFNGENKDAQTKIEIEDFNVNCEEEDKGIVISCIFDVKDEDVIIDSTNKTNLKDEFLLNEDGKLEIIKTWNCNKEKINSSDLKIYLKSYYPEIEEPLLNFTNTQLKRKLNEIEYNDDIDKSKNAEMRKVIHDYYISEGCKLEDTYIDLKKSDGKDMWKAIKNNLPIYFLFKSDRSNTDTDAEVQDPLKIATKEVLSTIQDQLIEIKNTVKEEVEKVGQATIEKLKEFNEEVGQELSTELKLKSWDSIFSFSLVSDKGVPLNKRGSGIRRLILLSYFRAEAERLVKQEEFKRSVIYAIEEPETSQHPDYQKMLIESLIILSKDYRRQILLTTHTPEIAKMVNIDQLIFIKKDMDNIPYFEKEEKRKVAGIVETLGILPTIMSKTVICVEGPNDVNFITNINKNIEEFRNIIDLEKEEIKIIPLKGGNLVTWVDKDYLEKSNIKEVHIYDRDVDKYRIKVDEMNNGDDRRVGFITSKREMENYINPKLIEERFNLDLNEYMENWNEEDIPEILKGKLNMSVENIKKILNGSVSKEICKESLEEIDAYDEIKNFFIKVKEVHFNQI